MFLNKLPWTNDELLDVAEKYYIQQETQQEIGKQLGRSRQDVARMLKAAQNSGIVQIRVAPIVDHGDLHELGSALRAKFSCLEDAYIVPGHPSILSPLNPESYRPGVLFHLAEAAAKYLSRRFTDTSVIAVGKGQLVKATINSIRLPQSFPEARIVSMIGFIREQSEPLDANVIASDLQRVSGSQYYWLPLPAMIPQYLQAHVRTLPIVEKAFKVMGEASLVITNIAAFDTGKVETFLELGLFTQHDVQNIQRKQREDQPVGEICGWLFDRHGKEVKTDLEPVGFGLQNMRRLVENKAGKVITVVGADSRRFEAIAGALRGHLINVLITDHVTAQYLLSRDVAATGA